MTLDWIVWLTLVAMLIAAAVVVRRHKRIVARNETRERLLSYRLEDMPHDETKPLRELAEGVGLDWETLLAQRGVDVQQHLAEQEAKRQADAEFDQKILALELDERQRQRAQEQEAIASIMAAMDDPHEIEAFKREHGL